MTPNWCAITTEWVTNVLYLIHMQSHECWIVFTNSHFHNAPTQSFIVLEERFLRGLHCSNKFETYNQDKFQAMMSKLDISIVNILQLRHRSSNSPYHALIGLLHIVNIIYILLFGRTLAHIRNLYRARARPRWIRRQEARDGYAESFKRYDGGCTSCVVHMVVL